LCAEEYKELKQDLERHAEKLRMAVEGLSREGKFG
jgi:predicted YcjX-like family ATPase